MAEPTRPEVAMLLHFAVLHRFATLLGDTGKIKLQKLVYFLQEALGVNLSYSYRFHHYGPYSEELEGDLSLMESIGLLSIKRDANGYGFHVSTAAEVDSSWIPSLDPKIQDNIQALVNAFDSMDAGTLELHATVHLANNLLPGAGKGEVVQAVRVLKPRFAQAEIEKVYGSLLAQGFIAT